MHERLSQAITSYAGNYPALTDVNYITTTELYYTYVAPRWGRAPPRARRGLRLATEESISEKVTEKETR